MVIKKNKHLIHYFLVEGEGTKSDDKQLNSISEFTDTVEKAKGEKLG